MSSTSSQASGLIMDRGHLPAGNRLYCVGDLHGRADLLRICRTRIADDLGQSPIGHASTIFLGDYVDRGPDSRGVLDLLCVERFPTPVVALRGNHEQMMIDFLRDPETLWDWSRYGALQTLRSYGITASASPSSADCFSIREQLLAALPAAHRKFLDETVACGSFAGYFFCHAGARPGIPLHKQSEQDLLWIRDDFLKVDYPFEKIVVHGHTPVSAPEVRSTRINLDTGAYASGRLTCLVLEDDRFRFLTL